MRQNLKGVVPSMAGAVPSMAGVLHPLDPTHGLQEWIDRDRTQLMLLSHDPRYTLVEVFFRSVLFISTLVGLCNFGFLIGARPSRWLPEQGWLLGLLVGLLVYLDPLYLGYPLPPSPVPAPPIPRCPVPCQHRSGLGYPGTAPPTPPPPVPQLTLQT